MDQNLLSHLDKLGIKYKVHKHSAVFTVEESNKIIKGLPGLHTKNLFLKDDSGKFYLVCMEAQERLNIKVLTKNLLVNKLRFASEEELKSELNLTPGSVSIFGMIYAKNVQLLLDEKVWEASIVNFHPNINTATLELDQENFKKFYNSLKCKKVIMKLE